MSEGGGIEPRAATDIEDALGLLWAKLFLKLTDKEMRCCVPGLRATALARTIYHATAGHPCTGKEVIIYAFPLETKTAGLPMNFHLGDIGGKVESGD